MLVSTAVFLIVSSIVTSALLQVTKTQSTIWNRTEMHSGVRGATELLQQEVGQAGRIALPTTVRLAAGIGAGVRTVGIQCVVCLPGLPTTSGMFVGEQLIVDTGEKEETVTLTAVNNNTGQITATFLNDHFANAPIAVAGGFATGIVPPGIANGSTATVLKLYGDINSDGKMVYIEYTCDTANHILYRNMMDWDAAAKPLVAPSQILLSNIIANPNNTPCFTYQTMPVGLTNYVIDVAITLTVQTQQIDAITKQYQTETKALLNVSPRNVFNVWQLASIGLTNRVQPMPPTIQTLIQ